VSDTAELSETATAVAEGRLPGRVWMYSNYHCNIACTYCLTDSGPKVPRRELTTQTMLEVGARPRRSVSPTSGSPAVRRSCSPTCPTCSSNSRACFP